MIPRRHLKWILKPRPKSGFWVAIRVSILHDFQVSDTFDILFPSNSNMVFSISNIRWSFGHVLRTPRMGLCQGYFKMCIFSQIWGTSTKDIINIVRQHVQYHYRKGNTSLGPLQNSNINPPYHHLMIFFISQKSKKITFDHFPH